MALHQWQGKAIIDLDHHHDLERDAAANEFGHTRLDRKGAEDAAYRSYRLKQHGEAIRHHLKSLRAARSQGLHEEAEKHAALYGLHMKALGLKAGSTPPDHGQDDFEPVTSFKPHAADQLLVTTASLDKSDREHLFKYANTDDTVYLSEPDENPELCKALRTPMSLDQLHGQKVRVYFNLHNRLFSVQHRGRVVAHVPEVALKDVNFRVNEAGRQRVLQEKRKNVHAFVEGTFQHNPDGSQLLPQGVTYNPYKYTSFVRAHDKSPIHGAQTAVLKNLPHPTITVQEAPQQHAEPSWIHGK
jgi:hypothetical protein